MNSLKKRYCLECNKKLVAIGSTRLNGIGSYNDWATRQYHKKCYSNRTPPTIIITSDRLSGFSK